MRWKCTYFFLFMTFFGFAHGQDLKAESSSTHSIETAAPEDIYYNQAAFIDRLKKLIRKNDKRTIAHEMVYYPFIWKYWTPEGKKDCVLFMTQRISSSIMMNS